MADAHLEYWECTYAAVNLGTSVLGLAFGHRRFLKRMSFEGLGKPGDTLWRFTWIITVCLHFATNALIAYMI